MHDLVQKYDDHASYYNNIKSLLLTRSVNEHKASKYRLIALNPKELVASIEKNNLLNKQTIVTIYHILWMHYKNALITKRKRSTTFTKLQSLGNGDNSDDDELTDHDEVAAKKAKKANRTQNTAVTVDNGSGGGSGADLRTSRFDYIPDYILKCNSRSSKIAVMLFLTNAINDVLRRSILFAICTHQFKTTNMETLINLLKDDLGSLRRQCLNARGTDDQQRLIIGSLLEIGHITKDRAVAKLAMDINFLIYLTIIKNMLQKYNIRDVTICEPFINRFLKECVAQKKQTTQRTLLINQFGTNPIAIVNMIEPQLDDPNDVVESASLKTKVPQLDNDQLYYVYCGEPNFAHDIIITNFKYKGNRYLVETLNDCIFDVLGYYKEADDYDPSLHILNGESLSSSSSPPAGAVSGPVLKLETNANITDGDTQNGLSGSKTDNDNSAAGLAVVPVNPNTNNHTNMTLLFEHTWMERINLLPYRARIVLVQRTGEELNSYSGTSDFAVSWLDKNGFSQRRFIKKRGRKPKFQI